LVADTGAPKDVSGEVQTSERSEEFEMQVDGDREKQEVAIIIDATKTKTVFADYQRESGDLEEHESSMLDVVKLPMQLDQFDVDFPVIDSSMPSDDSTPRVDARGASIKPELTKVSNFDFKTAAVREVIFRQKDGGILRKDTSAEVKDLKAVEAYYRRVEKECNLEYVKLETIKPPVKEQLVLQKSGSFRQENTIQESLTYQPLFEKIKLARTFELLYFELPDAQVAVESKEKEALQVYLSFDEPIFELVFSYKELSLPEQLQDTPAGL
jgi:hypothetical protein